MCLLLGVAVIAEASSTEGESSGVKTEVAAIDDAKTGMTVLASAKRSEIAKATSVASISDNTATDESDPFTGKAKRYVPVLACP